MRPSSEGHEIADALPIRQGTPRRPGQLVVLPDQNQPLHTAATSETHEDRQRRLVLQCQMHLHPLAQPRRKSSRRRSAHPRPRHRLRRLDRPRQGWLFLPLLPLIGLDLHQASIRTLFGRRPIKGRALDITMIDARFAAYLGALCSGCSRSEWRSPSSASNWPCSASTWASASRPTTSACRSFPLTSPSTSSTSRWSPRATCPAAGG